MTSRPLTQGEITLAQGIFGNAIDYGRVRIHDGKFMPFHPKGTGMAPEGNLYMYGCYHDDYSVKGPRVRAHFIHEMAHVWQYQNRILDPIRAAVELNLRHRFNYGASYAYHIDGTKDLLDYNMEQQATIIQDYFLLCREACGLESGHCRNADDAQARLPLYAKTLEKFLKDPAYARRDAFPARLRPPRKG